MFGSPYPSRASQPYDYEKERMREELDHYERVERERDLERQRMREEQRRAAHPSNRLYRGEVADFCEAVELHIACLLDEALQADQRAREWESDKELEDAPHYAADERRFATDLRTSADRARQALALYEDRVKPMERSLFEELAASPDETLRLIGEAALSGDYSGLAV